MHFPGARTIAGAVVLSGVTVTWSPFHSTLYPYTIAQPSSFQHAVITLDSDEKVDYFSPSLGSATTNVQVEADPGAPLQGEVAYLRSIDGHHIRQDGRLKVLGRARALMRADFTGYTERWTIEQVTFTANGYTWRLTASYAARWKSLRSLMLRMLQSFKLGPASKH